MLYIAYLTGDVVDLYMRKAGMNCYFYSANNKTTNQPAYVKNINKTGTEQN